MLRHTNFDDLTRREILRHRLIKPHEMEYARRRLEGCPEEKTQCALRRLIKRLITPANLDIHGRGKFTMFRPQMGRNVITGDDNTHVPTVADNVNVSGMFLLWRSGRGGSCTSQQDKKYQQESC